MHCNPDGSVSDGLSGRVCGPAEARTSGPRTQDPGPRTQGFWGREGGRGPQRDRRRRTLLTQETQPEDYCTKLRRCKRAEEDPSVGRLLVRAFHSGTAIGQVAGHALHRRPPTYRMTLMISVMQMQVQMQMQIPTDHAGTSAAMR